MPKMPGVWLVIRLSLCMALAMPVGGCAVADLVAHGVKTYEKAQDNPGQGQGTAQPVQQSAPQQPQQTYQAPRQDYQPEPAPRRDEVIKVEPLK